MEIESDFDLSSSDEWEDTSATSGSSSSSGDAPILARRYAASHSRASEASTSDTPGTSTSGSPRTSTRARGRPPRRSWSRGRPSSRSSSRESSPGIQPSTSTSTPTVLEPPPQNWSEDPSQVPDAPTFTGIPKINISCYNDVTPLNVVNEFLTEEFFQTVKTQTNLYASQKIIASQQSEPTLRYILKMWKPVTVPELKIFFAIMLHTGLVKKPQLKQYWSMDITFRESFCPTFMSRDRFTSILWLLHFNDNSAYIPYHVQGHDPLFRLRPVIDLFQQKFKAALYPEQNISLDEGTCPFKGRVRFRTYNPAKPHKWGIKLYQMCEAKSGYCFALKVATGTEESTTHNKTFDIVMDLTQDILDKGHIIFMDRYYSSPVLYDALESRNTRAVGTCMINRQQLPKVYLNQKLKKGELLSCRRKKLLALKWRDKKDVMMLSTIHNNAITEVTVRGRGGRKQKMKPVVVDDYNKYMAGVDKSDQMLSYYGITRKSIKWYIKLFFHLVNLAIVNAHILFNMLQTDSKNKITLLKFIQIISEKLAETGTTEQLHTVEQSDISRSFRLTGKHFPSFLPSTSASAHPQRVCRVCSDCDQKEKEREGSSRKLKTKRSSYWCEKCQVALCVVPCFEKYHTLQNYWE